MPTPIKMPALSPTMEEGTLAKWLVKPGDTISAGDIMAEIETDKATMEFEAVDEGTLASIEVEEGSEGVKVGTVIAMLAEEGEDVEEAAKAAPSGDAKAEEKQDAAKPEAKSEPAKAEPRESAEPARATEDDGTKAPAAPKDDSGARIKASPLARRIAEQKGIDLSAVTGSGPNGRIVKADVESAKPGEAPAKGSAESGAPAPAKAATQGGDLDAPYEAQKLNNVRKVIARRLTEAKQTIPHIYLTVDVRLDALLKLRGELNKSLEADGVKLSVNDLLIKALARALQRVPACNVSFQGDELYQYTREDISVAVAAPSGLITPIIRDAGKKGLAQISTEMKELAGKAKDGKLQPHEYQGGTASLSNLGMFGTKQFDAVINPPQAMILAVGAGEQRPHVIDGALGVATVMSATGSFDHRAIDGADGAQLMEAFRQLCENPMGLVV
ncbi:pyruvate dehydrogenase complex dihydrolipoamide acetyltransferase [Qipengyuania huizhouensis]|uniref:pyruvate dehydrogenase complex dihydrolipoamide acetyltransferase n=1 Tax=Qipengyuania huizhouensis TaxID=2867245 RepID=UPI0017FA9817|nr:pyruvate dehydrogenase complex dihydrolipoamide acetyltransferase [Qipengyuania huizhouensis]MBA4764759.1 pyruvate dehydrogenase complex dihydrolipoamide acetyltransferase [Erythrobacter sp.]MBX7460514.1 pyruvate dehydrogenase complex dihydrolipoamide acetyltransferase [Qipengyuania huizhouensis]